jgi:hypothetical protein
VLTRVLHQVTSAFFSYGLAEEPGKRLPFKVSGSPTWLEPGTCGLTGLVLAPKLANVHRITHLYSFPMHLTSVKDFAQQLQAGPLYGFLGSCARTVEGPGWRDCGGDLPGMTGTDSQRNSPLTPPSVDEESSGRGFRKPLTADLIASSRWVCAPPRQVEV